MDQRAGGGCCIARYGGGAGDMSKVDMIMLRFRPIAPKPATTNGSLSGGAPKPGSGEPSVKTAGRWKRRRTSKDTNGNWFGGRRRKKASTGNTGSSRSISDGQKVVETLPLLPETPDVKESPNTVSKDGFPLWLSFGGGLCPVRSEDPKPVVVSSLVKVECVTERWPVDGCGWYGLGRTDEDRVMSLDADSCPGFVSDGQNSVRWTNTAYRRMVGVGEDEEDEEVVSRVVVVVQEKAALPVECPAFTCRVTVVTCGKEKKCQTVPCDVWRMDSGGFAWRLDTTAALSLGR